MERHDGDGNWETVEHTGGGTAYLVFERRVSDDGEAGETDRSADDARDAPS